METMTVVEAARRALGPVGVLLPVSMTSVPPVDLQRDAVNRLEHAGYRAAWTNEVVGGKDALVQLAVLLAATERMVFGASIANMWARPRRPLTPRRRCYPRRFPAGSCSALVSATPSRRPASAANSAAPWRWHATTWIRWPARPHHPHAMRRIRRSSAQPQPARRCSHWRRDRRRRVAHHGSRGVHGAGQATDRSGQAAGRRAGGRHRRRP